MVHNIKDSIHSWLYSWKECRQCHFMILPKMISSKNIKGEVLCKDCIL